MKCKSGTTNGAHQIQSKQVDNSSQPGPKPKTTTSVDFQKGFLVGGSDGIDHVAIEVLQYDAADRGSQTVVPLTLVNPTHLRHTYDIQ